ncbi:MAG: hypothetical protein WCL06_08195, partial [Bacteroidota bacterium]
MKKLILILTLFLACTAVYSQSFSLQLIASSGGQTDNSTYKTSWSIGEAITETGTVAGNITLTQGFQQEDYCIPPVISGQATDAQTQCLGGTFAAIMVTATGTDISYQWYSNTNNSNSGGNSLGTDNGANTDTYTPQTSTAGTLYYYCVATNICGTASSEVSG